MKKILSSLMMLVVVASMSLFVSCENVNPFGGGSSSSIRGTWICNDVSGYVKLEFSASKFTLTEHSDSWEIELKAWGTYTFDGETAYMIYTGTNVDDIDDLIGSETEATLLTSKTLEYEGLIFTKK